MRISIDTILEDVNTFGHDVITKQRSKKEKSMLHDYFFLEAVCILENKSVKNYIKRWKEEKVDIAAIYPGLGHKVPESAEYIGEIIDGALYFIPSKRRRRKFKIYFSANKITRLKTHIQLNSVRKCVYKFKRLFRNKSLKH